jgi:hypothetical protein
MAFSTMEHKVSDRVSAFFRKKAVATSAGVPHHVIHARNKMEASSEKDHRLLHAVERAEKAVVHAIEHEVETLFPDVKHASEPYSRSANHAIVAAGVVKGNIAKKDAPSDHCHQWSFDEPMILLEHYAQFAAL